MTKIKQAQFLISAVKKEQWPQDDTFEFCFVGRSNVGKSTFLNTICNNNNLARVSQIPGKTQMLNFFVINNNVCRFVDVPGYGFAKVGNKQKINFATMMEEYFQFRIKLKAVFLLLDFRHAPSKDDKSMLEYLQHHHIKIYLIATKLDKVKKSQVVNNKKIILSTLNLKAQTPIILFSSITKEGVETVIKTVFANLISSTEINKNNSKKEN